MVVQLNGNEMLTKQLTHSYLKEKLHLSDYYGKNLDALWDELSTYSEVLHIQLLNKDSLLNHLGGYGESLIELLTQLETENKNITFETL